MKNTTQKPLKRNGLVQTIRVGNYILLNEVTRLSWINTSLVYGGLISVLTEVSRASSLTAGQSTDKASYWLFRSVISHLLTDL